MSSEFRDLKLPEQLCRLIEDRWIGDEFENLESFLRFIVEELLQESVSLDRAERRILEQRLRDLGYLR